MTKFTGDELMRIKAVLAEAQKENGRESDIHDAFARPAHMSGYARRGELAARRDLLAELINTFEGKSYK